MRNLVYIIEGAGWSTDWDGQNIVRNLKEINGKIAISANLNAYRHSLIHLGCLPVFFAKQEKSVMNTIHPSNKVILTIFHLSPDYISKLKKLANALAQVDLFHTSCQITKTQLVRLGLPAEKIVVIPLGVDLTIFTPIGPDKKKRLRQTLGITEDTVVIGSFQKDGHGWEEGNEPKLIKGPDIFCDVVEQLSPRHKILVVLTGPARGYVKKRLERAGIAYLHRHFDNYEKIVDYFRVLDLYLITSRAEGGPKAILECWATGIPVVSTAVGMVPDIAQDGQNVLLAASEDIPALVQQTERLIANKNLRERLVEKGLTEVQNYSWPIIADRYYQNLYSILT